MKPVLAILGLVFWMGLTIGGAIGDGLASYYWQGTKTANGERYNPDGISCAHRTIQFGTKVRVTNKRNGKSVVCRVNDRGPAKWTGREIDLSRGAAREIGMLVAGVVPVRIEIVGCAPRLTGMLLARC
jgi:rare lipoprotein A